MQCVMGMCVMGMYLYQHIVYVHRCILHFVCRKCNTQYTHVYFLSLTHTNTHTPCLHVPPPPQGVTGSLSGGSLPQQHDTGAQYVYIIAALLSARDVQEVLLMHGGAGENFVIHAFQV